MLFCCNKCGKFRKYGKWVDVPQRLLKQIQKVPLSYMLCQSCEEDEEEAGNSEALMYTDGGETREPFAQGNWNQENYAITVGTY